MDKKFIFFLCGIFAVSSAQAYTHQLDSVVRTCTAATYKFVPTYDDAQQTIGYMRYVKSGKSWANDLKMQFTLDANNRVTTIDFYKWSNSDWSQIRQETRAYNTAGKVTEHHIKTIQNDGLADSLVETFTYNTSGLLTSETYQKKTNGALNSNDAKNYYYNTAGQITKIESLSGVPTAKVQNIAEYSYTNGILTEKVVTLGGALSYKEVFTHTGDCWHSVKYSYSDGVYTAKGLEFFYYYNDDEKRTGYCSRFSGTLRDSTAYIYTAQGDLASFKQYDNKLTMTNGEIYQHSAIATEQCIGAATAHAEITATADAHTQVLSSYTLTESGSQTQKDVYYTHALPTTALSPATQAIDLYTTDGCVICSDEFRIYDLVGRDVTNLNGSLHGIYIVRTKETAQKVVVK